MELGDPAPGLSAPPHADPQTRFVCAEQALAHIPHHVLVDVLSSVLWAAPPPRLPRQGQVEPECAPQACSARDGPDFQVASGTWVWTQGEGVCLTDMLHPKYSLQGTFSYENKN